MLLNDEKPRTEILSELVTNVESVLNPTVEPLPPVPKRTIGKDPPAIVIAN